MIASDVISRARNLLNDTDSANYRWTTSELISAINDAQLVIATHRPDASSTVGDVTLVEGAAQTLSGTRLLDVVGNVSSAGVVGRAVTLIDGALLDAYEPSWRSGVKKTSVKHYIYDPRNPLVYEVYPPVVADTKLRIKYSVVPAAVTQESGALALADAYREAVFLYVMFKAYSKDAEFSGNVTLAAQYLGLFNSLLGIKTTKDNSFSPAANRKGDTSKAAGAQMGGVL